RRPASPGRPLTLGSCLVLAEMQPRPAHDLDFPSAPDNGRLGEESADISRRSLLPVFLGDLNFKHLGQIKAKHVRPILIGYGRIAPTMLQFLWNLKIEDG